MEAIIMTKEEYKAKLAQLKTQIAEQETVIENAKLSINQAKQKLANEKSELRPFARSFFSRAQHVDIYF
jgi:uncharacterized coiled-coil protein SlyX